MVVLRTLDLVHRFCCTSGGGGGGSKRNGNTGPEIPTSYRGGRAGGSGGGAARDGDNQGGGAANTPPHTKQIGNIGGNSPGNGSNSAGGGGGAGAQGQNQRHPDSGGHGGQGMRIRIAGNPVNPSPIGYPGPGSGADATGYFAAGGGGGGNSGPAGIGGSYDGSSLIPGGPYGGAGNGTWQGDPNPYGSAPAEQPRMDPVAVAVDIIQGHSVVDKVVQVLLYFGIKSDKLIQDLQKQLVVPLVTIMIRPFMSSTTLAPLQHLPH